MTALLACIDDSRYTQSVLDHVAWAARRLGAGVELLHALERHPERAGITDFSGSIGMDAGSELLDELIALDEKRAKLAMEQGRRLLDAATSRLAKQGVEPVHVRLRHGALVDVLDTDPVEHALLVMGKRGVAADFARLHLGSSLERVLRTSTQPVLVASREHQPIQRVLVAFDGSQSARKAVEMLARSPLADGLECHVVLVGSDTAEHTAQLAWAEEQLREARMPCRTQRLPGDVADALPAYAEAHHMSLLVMGAFGHSKMRELLLGSTTTTLLRRCLLPVLVVR